jgi:hypothetical protein
LEAEVEVWDSPNSAGVVTEAVRCAKLALEWGIGGALYAPSSYFMKSPPEQYTDDVAHAKVETFILMKTCGCSQRFAVTPRFSSYAAVRRRRPHLPPPQ